jgi:Tfp pilus assembly protein PilF
LKKKKSSKSKPSIAVEAKNIPGPTDHSNPAGKYFGLIIATFAFLLYLQSISFGYVLDDEATISENRLVQEGIKGIPTLMVTDFWHGSDVGVKVPLYRPGSFVLFAIEWQFFPDQPAVYHFVNVLLFALSCFLLFLLLQRLMKGWNLLFPFICALLYAAHPIHTEVVNNIKSADELLCFLFAILASLSALRHAKQNSIVSLILLVIFYFFSILCKETGIIFLLAIPMMMFFFTEAKPKKILTVFALLACAVIPYFLLRTHALQFVPAYETSPLVNGLYATTDFVSQRATALFILLKYEWLLLFPHPLSYNYDFAQIPIQKLTNPLVWISVILQIAALAYAIMNLKKKHLLSFSILFFFFAMAPVANILLIIGSNLGERFLYIPSLGFCLALTYGIFKISKTDYQSNLPNGVLSIRSFSPILLIIVGIIISLYSIKTFTRSRDWKDNVSLFGQDVKIADQSATAHYHWGNALLSQLYEKEQDPAKKSSYLDQAITEYQSAINIYPDYPDAILHLGDALYKKGEIDKAIPYVEQYNSMMNYSNPDLVRYMAQLYEQSGQFDEAIASYKSILNNNPASTPEVLYTIGLMYNKKKEYAQAITWLDSCLHLVPDHQKALTHKIIAEINVDRNQDAVESADHLLRLNPNNQKVYTYLAVAYTDLGNYPKAIEALENAIRLDPNDAESKERLKILNDFIAAKSH